MEEAPNLGNAADLLWIAGQTVWRWLQKGTEELQLSHSCKKNWLFQQRSKEKESKKPKNPNQARWGIPADLQPKWDRDLGATERSTAISHSLGGFLTESKGCFISSSNVTVWDHSPGTWSHEAALSIHILSLKTGHLRFLYKLHTKMISPYRNRQREILHI